jgi:hypothetical protein
MKFLSHFGMLKDPNPYPPGREPLVIAMVNACSLATIITTPSSASAHWETAN